MTDDFLAVVDAEEGEVAVVIGAFLVKKPVSRCVGWADEEVVVCE